MYTLFSNIISDQLEKYGKSSSLLETMIHRSCLSLLDSKMIIEAPLSNFQSKSLITVGATTTDVSNNAKFIELYEKIKIEGLGSNFFNLTVELFWILLMLCASEEQKELVRCWASSGQTGCFLFTDRGGPSIDHWLTECIDIDSELVRIRVNKIWGISGHQFDFTVIGTKANGNMIPQLYLIDPTACTHLRRSPIGEPFLEKNIQLGNVSGEIQILKSNRLIAGGMTGAKQYLTYARSRFILAVIYHLLWLVDQSRASLSNDYMALLRNIENIALKIIDTTIWNNMLLDDVLALKFIFNEFLLLIVTDGLLPALEDQRDCLAFSKMEGSSYRCFYELYTKSRSIYVK